MPDALIVGQSLSLECIVTTVRGINSSIDIIWRSDDVEIKSTTGASISSSTNSFILYRDLYNISLLTTFEDNRVYQCEGVINTNPNLIAERSTTLEVIGKYYLMFHFRNSKVFEFSWVRLRLSPCIIPYSLIESNFLLIFVTEDNIARYCCIAYYHSSAYLSML